MEQGVFLRTPISFFANIYIWSEVGWRRPTKSPSLGHDIDEPKSAPKEFGRESLRLLEQVLES
jgi:hypothetical protein